MKTTADPVPVVLLPSAEASGHELACATCTARTGLRPDAPVLAQIRAFTRLHAH